MPGLGIFRLAASKWKLLLGVALLVVVGFMAMRLQTVNARLETAQSKAENLLKTNVENALEVAEYKRRQQNIETAIKAEQDRRRGVQDQLTELRSRIDNAPHDGCVGPAVHAVIDGLRIQSADHKD
ncbi:MAG: hypothetical protein JKY47_03720 [Thalassospira sp.]|uniref:hypothetical protein n=1 Tax=Thalassospira sp. 11-3 TaxID=2135614 RepID=UPI000D86A5B9|nr:hypothetical protein [Thalassospira sp. 11-3]MBL4839921.1 hypothetical protein [Thalassospira sp.]PXX30863.1 hypothetical protein C7967_106123 [Thalassospira sp. 11-3]